MQPHAGRPATLAAVTRSRVRGAAMSPSTPTPATTLRGTSAITLAVLATVALPLRLAGQTPPTVSVPDEVSCARCTIRMSLVARLRSADGPGSIDFMPNAVRVDALSRYWVMDHQDLPKVFDETGRFVQVVGARGDGPGEFRNPLDAVAIGDSVLVMDYALRRATVVGPSLNPVRSIAMRWGFASPLVLAWPQEVVAAASINTPDRAGLRLHRVSFEQDPAAVVTSFGPYGGEMRPGRDVFQRISVNTTGRTFWTADLNRYALHEWSVDGKELHSLWRRQSWFPEDSRGTIGGRRTPPSPAVASLSEDATGLIWVFIWLPKSTWRDAWPPEVPGKREYSPREIAVEKLRTTVVEVINPRTSRVVARQPLDAYVVNALPLRRAVLYSVDPTGFPVVSVVSLQLERR